MRFLILLAAVSFLLPAVAPAAEVTLHRWSGDLNVPDPVACTVDEKGRVYVAATTRRKVGDLDIREHTQWIPDDVSFTSVEAKRDFYHRELAPGKMRRPRGSLKDHNKDGSIDWKDLTVHTERIYQLRDTDGDGTADKMTVFAEGFNTEVTGIAAGVLYHDGWVYTTIAPDLWRLKDTDDDGVADIREVVAHGFGMHIAYAGHDMHGPRLGPDGRIYWSIGDKGVNVTDKAGKNWYYPHEGAVMRVEPDGSGFEVFAHGLRNVQEVAFDDFGNIFGVDNDADMPGEKERFVYITERSDSGWRCNHQYMKSDSRWMRENIWMPGAVQPLFITPPLANASNGPAGFLHEPGTALGERLRGHFILNQFPSGKMEAFTAKPVGAAFEMSKTRLVNSGIMGIGMSWAPDGTFYMADWVGGYPLDEKGAIWSVDEEKGKEHPLRKETQTLLTGGFTEKSLNDLQILLGHADQRVRVASQLELAKREEWKTLAKVAGDTKASLLARIHGVWGYGIGFRRGQTDDKPLHIILETETDPEVQSQIAKVLSDGKPGEDANTALITLLGSDSARVRFHAAIALGKLEVSAAGDALRLMAEKDAADAWLRHAVVTGLTGCVKAEQLASLTASESKNLRVAATLALSRQHSPLVAGYLEDADVAIVNEASRAIHDDIGVPEALPQLAAMLDETHSLEEPTLRRAINANLRLGQPENASRLIQYALADKPLSVEAFQSLLFFTAPPLLDRVDGVYRTYPARDTKAVADVMQPHVPAMLALTNPDLKAAGVELMINLALAVEAPALQQIIADKIAKPELRVGALKLMAAQHSADPAFAETVKQSADKSAPAELRMESLAQTFQHQSDLALAEASRVLEKGTLAEKQAAMKLLAGTKTKAASDFLDGWMQRLAAGKVETGLMLDVMEAAQAHESLVERVTTYQQARTSAPRDDLVEGGDAKNGKDIVTNHLGANCLACHTVEEKEGSQVGPILKTIGSQRTKADLLESLVNPVAKIAPGYGLVSVTLKDGSNLAGALYKEDKASITIRLADGTETKLARSQISMQTPPISMMPPMIGILTPREVRDVVAYLGSLKPKKSTSSKKKDEH
ncbi:putative membrane-bound dehydrogenase-like protein [Prosthecobacter fusiformis]|uniref:Putative membrane-bound dehydrogenase-like protein n=1 Tax=Prosthecobacter fusiformis TaxID=48464 RepID=A0A4R7RR52_9BACT|nr:PVC-type heme-binding CxxCH protein [Prosthecobacter fusiformis]TDU67186.1 putative membrane-bound dehydrogenase-like protein [Prosthecobacter fusiformis]